MDFKQAIETCVRTKYATFSGRASRSEFWWFFLGTFIVNVVINILGRVSTTIGVVLSIVFFLATIVPILAVAARRLHDSGKSAWFLLLYLIPFIGWIVLLIFYLLPSDPKANAHGAPPVASPAAA